MTAGAGHRSFASDGLDSEHALPSTLHTAAPSARAQLRPYGCIVRCVKGKLHHAIWLCAGSWLS